MVFINFRNISPFILSINVICGVTRSTAIFTQSVAPILRWLLTVTVQLNIDQSLRYQNDLAFRFLMLKNSLKIMKTSFAFVNQEIRKQKLHKKCNRVSK